MPTTIKVLKKKKLSKGIMFAGLPGIGLVGKIVLDYLMKELKTEKIAEIYSDSFPPSVHSKKGLIELIKDELHYHKNGKNEYIFLSGPVQPIIDFRQGSAAEHYEFAEKIIESVKAMGVKEIYTLAGLNIGEKRLESAPRVVCTATNEKILNEFEKFGAVKEKHEGLISGAAGLILGIGAEHGIQGACLMGETNSSLIYGDPGSAKALLELLIKKHKFKVKMDKIDSEAKEIEKTFKAMEKQVESLSAQQETDEGPLKYVI
ncbi:MAG TPA: PAC2 family protein [archaeon]|nr:PAC2 family protein [archaeon]